jgi:hypothetical protein
VKINKYQTKSKKQRKVLPLTDCPVHKGTVAQRLVSGDTVEEAQTVRCDTGLSDAKADSPTVD